MSAGNLADASEDRARRTISRRAALAAAIAALVVGLVSGLVVARTLPKPERPPIRVGNGLFHLGISGPNEDAVERAETHAGDADEPMEIVTIPFQKDGTLQIVFPIFNAGDGPVRITGFGYGPDPTSYVTVLDPAGVEMGPQCCGDPLNKLRPFRPFVLESRRYPLIALNYDFVCQRGVSPGSYEIRDSFDLRFEIEGAERWVRLSLPWRLVLHGPAKGECDPSESAYRRPA